MLAGKVIVLGVTGSIAAYKAAMLASRLAQVRALVDVVMTEPATHFITPLTFRSLTGREVYVDMFDVNSPVAEQHVELARRADAMVIAPASATTIARLAHGLAEDMVSLTALATQAPILVAPAMDSQMFDNAATQANLGLLRQRGIVIVGPQVGRLASGRIGSGRMSEPEEILGALRWVLGRRGDLAGRRVVVSAGGTQEPIDPVRFLGNYSSGKMGYALAEAARDRGADVVLVSAPTALATPYGVRLMPVRTALEMRAAVLEALAGADALIMAAAPLDYRPRHVAQQKLKRGTENLLLECEPNPDILTEAQGAFVKVGFAAESQDLIENAREKLAKKGCDLFVANDITASDAGFAVDTNRVVILDRQGGVEALPLMSKYDVAHRILDRVVALLRAREEH